MASTLSMTQPTPACSEHELVALVREGSNRAFEELYSRYRQRISAYIYGMVGDHARTEDVAQEVFISALRRLRQTDRPIAFKPWIYEIAKNACIDEFRRTRRAREVPLQTPEDGPNEDLVLVSHAATPDAAVARKQSLEDLQGAFHGLSENHHKVIVMREFEGLSYTQIGEKLGMTRPVVESTLFRARRKLSEEYEELVTGRRCEQVLALIATEEKESLMKLGIRQRRQLARHLSHCQPCRREARLAELDESLFHAPGIAGKIAGLLPLPFPWLWRRRSSSDRSSAVAASSHSFTSLPGFQTLAQVATIVVPSTGFGRAAAAAAGLAAAGIGGGVVVVSNSGPQRAPASTSSVVSRTAGHGTRAAGGSGSRGHGSTTGHGKSAAPARAGTATRATPTGGGVAKGGPLRATGAKRSSQTLSSTGTAGPGGNSSTGGSHGGSSGQSSLPVTGSGQHQLKVGGVTVSASPPAGDGTIKTPSVSVGKVKLPTVSVSPPKPPKPPAAPTTAAPTATTGGPTSTVGKVVKGAQGAVQGVVQSLPKVSISDPGSGLPH